MELIKKEQLEKGELILKVKITKEEFDRADEKVFADNAHRVNVPGVKRGEATREQIKEVFGSEIFYQEVVGMCYNQAIDFVKKTTGIEFIAEQRISGFEPAEDGAVLVFKGVIYPELTLKKYKGLEVLAVKPVEVFDEDVNAEIQAIAQQKTIIQSVSREARENDTVNIDFEGFVDGVAFENGKAEGHDLVLGSGMFIPGFEEQLIGTKVNQEIDVCVTFPENYPSEELASKETVFKCRVNDVKETILPEINDEFAKGINNFETLEELKADIKLKLTEYQQSVAEGRFEDLVLNELTLNLEGEIPEIMITNQIENLTQDLFRKVKSQNMSVEDYLENNNLDEQTVRQKYRPTAEYQIKAQLALKIIVREENIIVTDEELEKEIEKLANMYKISVEEVKQSVPLSTLKADKAMMKATEFVFNNAVKK